MKINLLGLRTLLFGLCLAATQKLDAQNAPTFIDWVKTGQTYMEIKVGKDGVYRLPASLLANHFPNLASLNAAGFQLLRKGKEQAIFVNAGADNIMNGSDYIDFVGFMNTGDADLEMYQKPLTGYNRHRSIYDDTAHYFLTHSQALDGKRVINNGLNNNTSVPFEAYAWRRVSKFNTSDYLQGTILRGATYASYIFPGEGWGGKYMSKDLGNTNQPGSTASYGYAKLTDIQNFFLGGPKPELELLLSGRLYVEQAMELYLSTALVFTDTIRFPTYKGYLYKKEIEKNLIENGTLSSWVKAVGTTNAALMYTSLRYPASFQMPNGLTSLVMELPANPSNYARIKFDNLAALPEFYDATDALNPVKIGVGFVNGAYVAGVENAAEQRRLVIQNQPFVVTGGLAQKCSFTHFNPLQFDYLLVSHPSLQLPALGYSDPVAAYASYRASPQGGGYKVLTLMMEEVYQRFGYGDHTPLALRNLGGYFAQNEANLKCMFLVGKGISIDKRNTIGDAYHSFNLIPTFGTPPSDNAYAVGLGQTDGAVKFPVGRLAAYKPEHVAAYLNKVKESEAFTYDDLWKKNAFLISGGSFSTEQQSFTDLVNNSLKPRLEGPQLGAHVGTYNKNTSATVQPINIKSVLNNGISLLTLFGHSSRNSPDVEIGLVTDPALGINNVGKYPAVILNGCFSGDVFGFNETLNENWVLTPNKGAILFLSPSDEGFSALLRKHIEMYFQYGFQDSASFGETAGKIQMESMRRYFANGSSDPQLDSAFMHQFVLHGDPMIRIFGARQPDYYTSNADIFIATPNANASSANLKIGVVASNFGRFSGDTLEIGVRRRFADGSSKNYLFRVGTLAYKDTFFVDLPQNEGLAYAGTNRIEVTLDFRNITAELNEGNNTGIIEMFIPTSGIIPLFPKNYSIVSSRNVTITVQSTDLLAGERRFLFQLDTSANFTAPLQSQPITASNIAIWRPLLPYDIDSTVFFWRVKFMDPTGPTDTTWFTQSFEYIKNSSTGWAQSQFYQFKQSDDYGVAKNYVQRRWDFPQLTRLFDLQVSGGAQAGPKTWTFNLDGTTYLESSLSTSNCVQNKKPRICAIHLSKCSLLPEVWDYWNDPARPYLSACGRLPFYVNMFEFDRVNTKGDYTLRLFFQSYINNHVPVGDYVIVFPIDSVRMDSVRKYISPVLPLIGVNPVDLQGLGSAEPFILFGQRTELPSPGQGTVVLPLNDGTPKKMQKINLQRTLSSACVSGSITSTRIGPASRWFSLFNQMRNMEKPVHDKYFVQLIGITLQGKDSVLQQSITQFPFDLSAINADTFPYLKLRVFVDDTVNNTPASIKRWMVTYDGVPEGVINTNVYGSSSYKVPALQEGDSLGFRYAYTNISQKAFRDSVVVQFSLNGQLVESQNLGLIPPDSTVRFQFKKFSTLGKPESNQLVAFVNPRLQPEEYYENNALNVPFTVMKDRINPVLDVTFDGVKIMNGDFVAAKPLIAITLKDENKFLLKGDTAGMTLLLTRPCQGCQQERIALNSPNVKVFPAGKDNMFRLEYRPEKLDNGMYRLAVQGADVKGNESGGQSYQVDFQVLDQNTITNFYPYPNPFSTSCQWVFTITGEFPQDFKIQILTVTGRVVREITKAELGPLRIGNNISSYRWDATDEYGDRLANGVYLYRVVMKEGATFVHRATEGDHSFTKGFGKLYIIR